MECTHSGGVRLGAGATNGGARRALTPIRSDRDGLGEPLDVRDIVRLSGILTAGV